MKLRNVVVRFTVTLPEITVESSVTASLEKNRQEIIREAAYIMSAPNHHSGIESEIIDCPDYPLLNSNPV